MLIQPLSAFIEYGPDQNCWNAIVGTLFIPTSVSASSFVGSNALPGSTPSLFSLSIILLSAAFGGFSCSSFASRPKNTAPLINRTWSNGVAVKSTFGSTAVFDGGVYGLPHALKGVIFN